MHTAPNKQLRSKGLHLLNPLMILKFKLAPGPFPFVRGAAARTSAENAGCWPNAPATQFGVGRRAVIPAVGIICSPCGVGLLPGGQPAGRGVGGGPAGCGGGRRWRRWMRHRGCRSRGRGAGGGAGAGDRGGGGCRMHQCGSRSWRASGGGGRGGGNGAGLSVVGWRCPPGGGAGGGAGLNVLGSCCPPGVAAAIQAAEVAPASMCSARAVR